MRLNVFFKLWLQLNSEINMAKKDLKRAHTIMQMDELKCRKRVLRRYREIHCMQRSKYICVSRERDIVCVCVFWGGWQKED